MVLGQGPDHERLRRLCADAGPIGRAQFWLREFGSTLEHFGINEVASDVPGAVPITAAERAYYTCGDLTPADVAAGNTTLSCFSPGNGLPEAPYAVAFPLVAPAVLGAVFMARRRRVALTAPPSTHVGGWHHPG